MVSGSARARKSWSAVSGAVLAAALAAALASVPATATGRGHDPGTPGAPGAGDPYFPLDGNGGYDVRHYDLGLGYDPDDGVLHGVATISARATQALSRFNLDLVGMDVERITVDGVRAGWTRDGQELQVTPRRGLRDRKRFTVRVTYSGVPQSLEGAGFVATDDGFVVAGQPHGAAAWFPANDHPTDTASYRFRVTVPTGLEAVANGRLEDVRRHRGRTTWTWHAREPMASYLTTVDVGEFELDAYREDGIRYVDAVDPDLYTPITPTTGERMAISQAAPSSYKRLVHTIDVPAEGATVDFTVHRAIEPDWDFFLVEAHTVGQDDWTTLPDTRGHTTQDTGNSCPLWPDLHPFLSDHYLTVDQEAGTCEPTGATGEWWAATGLSLGPEQWRVDLSRFAGSTVELALTTVGDDLYDLGGAFVDDVVVSTGQGSTSFEDGLGTWTVPGAPEGSPGNANDWVVGTAADAPPPIGTVVDGSLARQPEIIDFLEGFFGRYPFRDAGGIVDDVQGLGFALETQTRPIYALDFFSDPVSGDAVVVHELAHQWYGDSLTLERWRDIWLNEGFATYAEWLWSEAEGLGTAQETFDFFYDDYAPADDPWWDLLIGDPGPFDLFAGQVYLRGAMTVHALRLAVGDADFFRILRVWPQSRAGDHVTTPEFIALAERISGEELDPLFQAWLLTPGRPEVPGAVAGDRSRQAQRGAGRVPPAAAASLRIARAERHALTAP